LALFLAVLIAAIALTLWFVNRRNQLKALVSPVSVD